MSESGAKGKSGTGSKSGETAPELLRRTKQITRRKFPAEEKIRILLEGIQAEFSVAELCRRVGSPPAAFRAPSGGTSVPARC
jgi:transposase-like protein